MKQFFILPQKSLVYTVLLIALYLVPSSLKSQTADQTKDKLKVPKEILETYLGKYQMGPDTLKIIMQGDSIKAHGPGHPPLQLIAKKENRFLLRRFGVDIEFVKGADGKIEKLLMIRADGQSLEAKKIE